MARIGNANREYIQSSEFDSLGGNMAAAKKSFVSFSILSVDCSNISCIVVIFQDIRSVKVYPQFLLRAASCLQLYRERQASIKITSY